ncbi:MAG: HIT family protein [Isosphaeraceae bacterium]
MPKRHHENVLELTDDEAGRIGALLPRLCRALMEVSGAEGFHIVVNNGRAAGQTVFHGHWHLIPRFPGDAVRWPWPHQEYAEGARAEFQRKIIDAIEPG